MKKLVTSTIIIVSFVIYALAHNKTKDVIVTPIPMSTGNGSNSSSSSNSITVTSSPYQYKDGEYTGVVADAFYGNIQVKAIIRNGKLVDVQFLQYPNDQGQSVEINTFAMPNLKSEAILAQNANVDIVSGATDSSNAFIQSLSSALVQAK